MREDPASRPRSPDARQGRTAHALDRRLGLQLANPVQYYFARPVPLPKGTRLDLVAYYDNSAGNPSNPFNPPRRVKYGIRSDAEMLGCHVQILADDEEAQRIFEKALPPGL